jgi:hypothetical protein
MRVNPRILLKASAVMIITSPFLKYGIYMTLSRFFNQYEFKEKFAAFNIPLYKVINLMTQEL